MAEITARVETAMLHFHEHQVVTLERTDYVDLLIAEGRLTVLSAADLAGEDGVLVEDDTDVEEGAGADGEVDDVAFDQDAPPVVTRR